jgi:hypothetical protein
MQIKILFLAALVLSFLPAPAFADEGDAKLAKQTQNPVADLISVPFQFNYDHDIGPEQDGKKYYLNIQPVIPIHLNED